MSVFIVSTALHAGRKTAVAAKAMLSAVTSLVAPASLLDLATISLPLCDSLWRLADDPAGISTARVSLQRDRGYSRGETAQARNIP